MTNFQSPVFVPVVFNDGERDMNLGDVGFHHQTFDFKSFRLNLSQKIGFPTHQISVYVAYRKRTKSPQTRRVLINEKTDFGSIARDQDWYFLVELKVSRRERRGRARVHQQQQQQSHHQQQIFDGEDEYIASQQIQNLQKKFAMSPPQKMLLRRDPPQYGALYDPPTPQQYGVLYDPMNMNSFQKPNSGLGFLDYESQLRNLQLQRENYLISTNPYPHYGGEIEEEFVADKRTSFGGGVGGGGVVVSPKVAVCEVCLNNGGNGRQVPFHSCVYDPPTHAFRSPAGPIARPSKREFA